MSASRFQIRLAADIGALCSRVGGGQASADTFLLGLAEIMETDGALLAVRLEDGSVAAWTRGLDDQRARRLLGQGLEPPGLELLAAGQFAWRMAEAEYAGDPVQDHVEEELLNKLGVERLLRLAVPGAVVLLCRFAGRDDFPTAVVDVVSLLESSLTGALDAVRREPAAAEAVVTPAPDSFAPRIDTAALRAWSQCPVPLVLLDESALVLSANSAARRKVDVRGNPPTLPAWLAEIVRVRLLDLQVRGLPDDASGDYQFVRPAGNRRLVRLGLAPVAADDDDGGIVEGDRWLLSVEHGGPSLEDRIAATVVRFGLTPKEAEILDLLAEGLTNRKIADVVMIVEASVKYRLKRIMEKTGTGNRTDLLATVYSQTPAGK